MPVTVDLEKLKAACNLQEFLAFEREAVQAVEREAYERRRNTEDEKRAKEKRARKKRLKAASRASS
ncbi:MAG TPA: hypothetical protein VM221_12820 [Armatimonadota bacterium]|nr:hypothetical protein [Armatimonadota bacterium]